MAKTLSDMVLVAMIESATRLAGGRGPVGGSAAQSAPLTHGATEIGAQAGHVADTTAAEEPAASASGATEGGAATGAATTSTPAAPMSHGGHNGEGEHDTRTAEQIAADFKTIYNQIDEVVRASAEQETKTFGFGTR